MSVLDVSVKPLTQSLIMKRVSTVAASVDTYTLGNKCVKVGNCFKYEVTLYYQFGNAISLKSSRLFQSNSLLEYQHRVTSEYKKGLLIKFIDLIEAPLDYLKKHGKLVSNENTGRGKKVKTPRKSTRSGKVH